MSSAPAPSLIFPPRGLQQGLTAPHCPGKYLPPLYLFKHAAHTHGTQTERENESVAKGSVKQGSEFMFP